MTSPLRPMQVLDVASPTLRRLMGGTLQACKAAIAIVVLVCVILASGLRAADGDPSIKSLVERMSVDGEKYDPQPLLDHGVAGMRAIMDQVFPETAGETGAERARIASLVEQLGDETFKRREEAAAALHRLGSTCVGVLRQSIDHKDAEVRFRVRKLLAALEAPHESRSTNLALQAYLNKLKDVECQQQLACRVTKALEARLDTTPKQDALKICLEAMTRWPTNRVHNELLPLLKLEDPTPAVFAMRQISGRTGNNYVSAIHMGAIASGRPELIKCGYRSMPGPVWDKENKPKIKVALEHLFDDSKEHAELRGDADFMFLSAFVAARDFKIAKARHWLIAQIEEGNEQRSLEAVHSLGDTYYMRQSLDPELLAALKPHLRSEDPKFRAAAVSTLGVYRGEAVHPLLVKAFADPVKEVWQTAGERLKDQHSYFRSGSPIPKLLESTLQTNEDPEHRSRLSFLLKHLQQDKPGFLKWPE